jgi:hypothetical protein
VGTAFLVVIIGFLMLAVFIGLVELQGGCLGDTSMVPGCLGFMVVVLVAMCVIGLVAGTITLRFN